MEASTEYMRSDPLPRYVHVLADVLNRNGLDAHDIIGATLPVPECTNVWWDGLRDGTWRRVPES
jgi:hypothetical protein